MSDNEVDYQAVKKYGSNYIFQEARISDGVYNPRTMETIESHAYKQNIFYPEPSGFVIRFDLN